MAKIQTGDVVDLFSFSKASASIGDIRESLLTLAQFQEENLGEWFLMDGRSCVGTAYHALTGKVNVPDMTTEGAFLRQAKSGRAIGSYEGDAIRNIVGTVGAARRGSSTATGAFTSSANGNGQPINEGNGNISIGFDASRVVPTANENRPKNVAVN